LHILMWHDGDFFYIGQTEICLLLLTEVKMPLISFIKWCKGSEPRFKPKLLLRTSCVIQAYGVSIFTFLIINVHEFFMSCIRINHPELKLLQGKAANNESLSFAICFCACVI
jgi:hypothetical protein